METGSMSGFKNSDDFNERLSTGAKASSLSDLADHMTHRV
jgi:hypothetical protein